MIVVYTAICGGRDKPRNDVTCFSTYAYDRFRDPRMNAKIHKVLAHQFIDAEYSIWVDGNVRLLVPPHQLVEMMGKSECAVFRHCERNDIYEEAEFVVKKMKDHSYIVNPQVAQYRRAGFTARDLGMCFLIVRRHTPEIARRNERWWSDICRHSMRDQLSFPVAFEGVVNYWPPEPVSGRGNYYERGPHAA